MDDGQPRFDAREYEIFQRSQVELIKSDFVLQAALREPGIASLPILAPHHDPVQWLSGHVEATFLGPSEILAIRIRGVESESGDLQQLVDAVAEAYVKQVIHAEKQRRLMKQDTKARAAAALREEVAEKTLELQSAIEQHDSDSPEVKLAQLELDIVTDLWREVHRGFKTDEIEGGAPDRIRQVQPAVVLPE